MGLEFCKVDTPKHLIKVVEQRMPLSCFILNQINFHDKAADDLEIFSLGSGPDTWIITKYLREDYGMVISISAPNTPEISKEIRDCIKSSGVIDWNKPFLFSALQGCVTKLITDINVEDLGKIITIYPCHLFYVEPSQALTQEISPPLPENVEVRRLDVESGTPFIADNWKYSKGESTHSMVRKSIQRFPSGGVFVDKKLVTGAITPAFGLISMLHTDPEHRRKGYASYTMRFIFRELAREGLQPCLASEIVNKTAINFHRNLGLQQVEQVNFIKNGD